MTENKVVDMLIRCNVCHIDKPFNEFYDNPGGYGGKRSQCIPCRKYYNKIYYNNHKQDLQTRAANRYRTLSKLHKEKKQIESNSV